MIKFFGIILLLVIIKKMFFETKYTLKEKFLDLLPISVVLGLFVDVGYFIKIGSYELLYSELLLLILIIISIFIILTRLKNIKIKISLLFFLISIIVTQVFLIIYPIEQLIYRNGLYILPKFSFNSLLVFLRVIMMIIISVVATNIISEDDIKSITNKLLKYTSYIYIICVLEWITKNILKINIYNSIIGNLFGKGEFTVDFLLERGSTYSLQGLSREPAHLSFGLFMFLMILIFSNIEVKRKNVFFIIGIILLILSGSLSAIGYSLALLISYIIQSRKKINLILISFLIILTCIFIIPNESKVYYISRILNSLNILLDMNQVQMNTSEQVRLFSITETLKTVFLNRKIFGAGLSIPYAYSGTVMILSSIGIIGFVNWFWYYFISIGQVFKNNKFITIIIIMLISLTFIGSINIIYSSYILLLVINMKYYCIKKDIGKINI